MTHATTVDFGLFIPQMRMPYGTIEERVRVAEASGFASAWLMDHMVPPGLNSGDCYEAFTLATALAMRTETIRLGHLVLCNQFRHPSLLSKMVVTLDHLSGGRFDLGIGWGSYVPEFTQFGFDDDPPAVRSRRLRETLEILSHLWTGEPFDYEGRCYTLRGAQQRPVPLHGKVPIMIGGGGPKLTMPLVQEFADWWNCPSYAVAELASLRPQAGTARVSTQHPIGLVHSEATRAATVDSAEKRFGNWGGLITGDVEQVAEALIAEVKMGVELFLVPFTDFASVETIELFGREVIPAVRAATS